MKHKKIPALILSVILLFSVIISCDSPDNHDDHDNGYDYEPDVTLPDDIEVPHDHSHTGIDFGAAIASFHPDTIMIKADGLVLTWAEFYVFLFGTVSSVLHSFGEFDWDEKYDNETFADLVLEISTEEAKNFMINRYGIQNSGLVLSSADLVEFNNSLNNIIENYGGRDSFEEFLPNNAGFLNLDVFTELFKTEFTFEKLIDVLYSADSATGLSDEKVAEFAAENDFMMAMHILRLKSDDPEADPYKEAEEILKQLNAQLGSDNFEEFFFDLMHEQSEDYGGLMSSPNGYLFLHEDMVREFSDTTAALEIGELSGIVETVYGYHIILRIPIDYDAVPSGLSRQGISQTLREVVARSDFEVLHSQWRESLNFEFTADYLSIDLAKIFVFYDEDCDE